MWGSDFPHPDGVWPDSSQVIARELGHLPAAVRRKIVSENAGKPYSLISGVAFWPWLTLIVPSTLGLP